MSGTLETWTRRIGRRARAIAIDVRAPRALLAHRRELRRLLAERPFLADDLRRLEPPDARRILLISLSGNREQVRFEAVLTKVLQLRGAVVHTLTFRSARRDVREARAMRAGRLVFYEDFAPAGMEWDPAVLGDLRTVHDFKTFTYRGARVGRQALSTVVRSSHEPRIDIDSPAVRARIAHAIEYAIEGVFVAEAVLDKTAPDLLLMTERGYAGLGSVFDVALTRGIPVVQFSLSHRDDAFFLKRYHTPEERDLAPRSLASETWQRLLADGLTPAREQALEEELDALEQGKWFLARRVRHSETSRSSDELRAKLGLDGQRKVAVLFPHVLWDASMFYGRDVYPDQGRWFAETIRLAAQDDRVQWLIKLHPALLWKLGMDGIREQPVELEIIRATVGELPPHMQLLPPEVDVRNADLFRIADVGITIRGTVGMELPPLGIPVITAGTSDYSGRGFTIDAATPEEYEANVRAIPDLDRLTPDEVRKAKLYSYGIFCARPWRFESFAIDFLPLNEAGDTLGYRFRFDIATPAELRQAGDLSRFASWVLESDEPDYVEEDTPAAALEEEDSLAAAGS